MYDAPPVLNTFNGIKVINDTYDNHTKFIYWPESHNFSDLEYWSKRWDECFPCTYPPELYETIFIEKESGWGPFKKQMVIEKRVCARCKDNIRTGHQCKDIYNYIESRLNG